MMRQFDGRGPPPCRTAKHMLGRPGQGEALDAEVQNNGHRTISEAAVSITCEGQEWLIPFHDVEPGILHETQRALPKHGACERYEIGLKSASWKQD